ncbi:acyltransferase family protein [Micrococcus luteus]|uniref:acyltransferase family protein n=1 Tax=Micrococcus luteus TaxID=1270 RepID=UPI002795F712|nr:acyltransferase family protein [Micrococcus luteus]
MGVDPRTDLDHPGVPRRHRPDIQGLRTIAVTLVVLQHTAGLPAGGFIGVDVFFVVSGFLITGILLRDIARHGRIDLMQFYTSRVRRIVPAAVVTAVVTVAVAWIVWFTPRALQVTLDGLWSVLWVANWHFVATGTDYLAGGDHPSPFQHYWSLSVEEQFYAAWPWLLVGVTVLAARFGTARGDRRLAASSRWTLLGVGALLTAGFIWSVVLVAARPEVAYFDLISRSWELLVGAFLAVLAHRGTLHRPGSWCWAAQRWFLIAGVAMIVVGAFLISESTPFPGLAALVPVVGSALVVAARKDAHLHPILTNPVAVWLGDRSYSLYLWHFPVVVFASTAGTLETVPQQFAAIGISLGLAWASHRYIEEPFRRRRGRSRSAAPAAEDDGIAPPRSTRMPSSRGRSFAVGAAVAAAIALFTVIQFLPSRWGVIADRTMSVAPASAPAAFADASAVADAVSAAVAAPQPWAGGEFAPSPDALTQRQIAAPMHACPNTVGTTDLKTCVFGDGPRHAMLVGDSVALAWTPAVHRALGPAWTLTVVGVASCAPWDAEHGARWGDPAFVGQCARSRDAVDRLVEDTAPDLVIASGAQGGYLLQPGPELWGAWAEGAAEAISQWRTSGAEVVALGSPPPAADLRTCVLRIGDTHDCLTSWSPETPEVASSLEAGAERAGVPYIDVRPWFCTVEGKCPAAVSGMVVRTDPTHITAAYAESLGDVLRTELEDGLPDLAAAPDARRR